MNIVVAVWRNISKAYRS